MIERIKKVKDTVKDILIEYPKTRDNDHLLLLYVWTIQNPMLKDKSTLFIHFAGELMRGKYAHFESISRVRRKLQENHPELRGDLYNARHTLSKKVRDNIHTV